MARHPLAQHHTGSGEDQAAGMTPITTILCGQLV